MDYEAGENIQVTVLPNGLTIATAKRPIHTVMVSVFVKVGARFETEAENGISHFLEHMAFKGTKTRTAKDIVVEIESIGASINAFTSRTTTGYMVNGLPNHIGPALDILSDVLRNSTLLETDILSEQNVVVEEIYESADDIQDTAMNTMCLIAYPDQAIGRPILGSEQSVRSFDREMLFDYVRRHYHAGSMIVMAVGAVEHATFVTEAVARFGDVSSLDCIQPAQSVYRGGTAVTIDDRYDQAHMYVAFPAPGGETDDFARFDLLSDILGSGMSAPLFQEVREKRSLCYSVSAGMMPQVDTSLFLIEGSASKEKVRGFIACACGELAKIANGNIDDADWERARNQILRQVVERADSTIGTASKIAAELFTFGRVKTIDEQVNAYMALTREDVIAAARELLRTTPTIVVAGNAYDYDYATLVAESLIGVR